MQNFGPGSRTFSKSRRSPPNNTDVKVSLLFVKSNSKSPKICGLLDVMGY